MNLWSQLWSSWTHVDYSYSTAMDRHRASGIMKMVVGTIIASIIGVPAAFVQPSSVETSLFAIGGLQVNTPQLGFLLVPPVVIAAYYIIRRAINRGALDAASQTFVLLLLYVAVMVHFTNHMYVGTLLALSMPVAGAAVLLDRRGLIRVVLFLIGLLVIAYILEEQGITNQYIKGGFGSMEALMFGSLILVVDGIILNVFLVGQNLIYRQNLDLMTNLEERVAVEQQVKTALQEAVNAYSAFAQRVATGDLTARLPLDQDHQSDAEGLQQLGENLNAMVEALSQMAIQTRETAKHLAGAAAEILAATTEQSASAVEQDAAVTQTMAAVEQVRATMAQTVERASTVAEVSQQSVAVSVAGQEAVTDSVDGMRVIQERVNDIASTILTLSERTQQIGEIIDTVNDIADQSKLLALNASIEAARAGEEGRGFGVVAMEVRQLAEQSREATDRVRDILQEIQQATNTAVMVTEEGSKGADAGAALVNRAGESIRDLGQAVEQSAQTAAQIAASAQQQRNGMEQVVAAMTSIKQAAAQTASSTRQTEESVHNLTEMARQLEEAVARYRV